MLYRERGFEEVLVAPAGLDIDGFSPRRTKTLFTKYARKLMALKGTGNLTFKKNHGARDVNRCKSNERPI